jgi:predicted amidohydrolase YtcJ
MTREEAMRSFTSWNAYASRQEGSLGTLEPSKLADLVVLSDDLFACAEERIKDVTPVLTLVGGEIVFRSASF